MNSSKKLLLKYPSKRPIIINPVDNKQPNLLKNKFLVESNMTISEFLFSIRKYIVLDKEETIFLFINNNIVKMSELVSEIYERYKEDDILYIQYAKENTFG